MRIATAFPTETAILDTTAVLSYPTRSATGEQRGALTELGDRCDGNSGIGKSNGFHRDTRPRQGEEFYGDTLGFALMQEDDFAAVFDFPWVRARRASLALPPQRPRQDERRTGGHMQHCTRAALGFMVAGPLARSVCPNASNPVGDLVHKLSHGVAAAEALLDRGWGKPKQSHEAEITHRWVIEIPALMDNATWEAEAIEHEPDKLHRAS
jgi:hypothetical protein